jgi:plastocyanin
VRRAAFVVGAALALAAPASAAAPARLLVGAKEFRFTLSRTTIKAGPAIIQLQNFGEDDHNLNLKRIGGTRTYRIKTVAPGADVGELETRLAAGKYKLWCSLADHAARGMRATLTVKK